jgi:hypothetical protein
VAAERTRALAGRLRALPALLLVAVALLQIWMVEKAGLSPWLGGGFGMFSTTDSWARRHLHAVALRPGLREELDVPDSLRTDVRRALALPSERHLRALARALEAIERESGDPDAAPLEAIAIGVYRVRFDPATLAPSGEPIASLQVPAGAE